jgi:hypothetical protein
MGTAVTQPPAEVGGVEIHLHYGWPSEFEGARGSAREVNVLQSYFSRPATMDRPGLNFAATPTQPCNPPECLGLGNCARILRGRWRRWLTPPRAPATLFFLSTAVAFVEPAKAARIVDFHAQQSCE